MDFPPFPFPPETWGEHLRRLVASPEFLAGAFALLALRVTLGLVLRVATAILSLPGFLWNRFLDAAPATLADRIVRILRENPGTGVWSRGPSLSLTKGDVRILFEDVGAKDSLREDGTPLRPFVDLEVLTIFLRHPSEFFPVEIGSRLECIERKRIEKAAVTEVARILEREREAFVRDLDE